MRSHFDNHVGVVAQHLRHRVESGHRFGAKCGLVEVVENVFHHLGLGDRGEDEVDIVFGIFFGYVAHEFLLGVEVSLSAGEHHIVHTAVEAETERAVVACHFLLY